MILQEVIYSMLTNDTALTGAVGSNIYFKKSNPNDNDFTDIVPVVLYERITGAYRYSTKSNQVYQITARATTMLQAEEIANIIRAIFDNKRTEDYNYSIVRFVNDLYDPASRHHGVALTVDFIYRDT